MEKTVKFRLTNNSLPRKSGQYIVIMKHGGVNQVEYSEKYRAFNSYDNLPDNSHAFKLGDVIAWAPALTDKEIEEIREYEDE